MTARILLLMMHVVFGEAAEVFLVTPTSLNVTGGTVAEFNCSSRVAISLFWTVNGSEITEPNIRDQGIIANLFSPVVGVTGTRLTIPTMIATSNTIVVCGAFVLNENTITLEKSSALLMLQGPPGRVSGLMGESVSGTLHLSWTPPPTIDLTDIDPDLHYNVTITKTVSRADESVDISCMECPLLTPEYSFTPDPCVTYSFSVFAFNAAGKGEIRLLQYSLCLELTPAAFTAYEGQEVNFTCGVTGAEVVIWRLNGVAVTTDFASLELALPVDVRIAGTLVAVILTVPATLARNGFTIQCIGFPSVSSSSNSTLQVQGLLSSPTNLNFTESGSAHFLLSWDPPFSLDLTSFEPDISLYRVCNNVTNHCLEINPTELRVPRLSVPVEWRVSGVNPVGEGNSSATLQQQPCSMGASSLLPTLESVSIKLSFSDSMTELVLSFGRNDSCFPIYQLTSTLLSPGPPPSPEVHGPALPSVALSPPSSASTYVVTLTLELSLAFNERFSLVMDLFDDKSNSFVKLTDIWTYDVQSIEVGRLPGAVRVTCNFATGSLARGCLVVITESGSDTNSTETWTGNAMRDDLNDQSAFYERDGFPEGMYDVTVFDIESDGSVASSPGQRGSVIVDPLSPGAMPSSITPSKAAIIAGSVLGGLIALVLVTLIIIVLCVAVTRSRTVSHGNKFKEGELTDYYNVQPPGSSRETTSFATSADQQLASGEPLYYYISPPPTVAPPPSTSSPHEDAYTLPDKALPLPPQPLSQEHLSELGPDRMVPNVAYAELGPDRMVPNVAYARARY